MGNELVGTVPYLKAVRARFGSERKSYDEFFRIYLDFKERIHGHEIMRRSKELFDGDEEMVTGFYRLLLEQKRKKKRSDDFGNALTSVCPLMNYEAHKSFSEILYMLQKNDFTLDAFQQMGQNKRSHCNDVDVNVDCTDSENKKQRCIKKDSREDSKGNDNAKISHYDSGKLNKMQCTQKNPKELGSSGSSSDHESNMTGLLRIGGHFHSLGNAKDRETFMKHDIVDGNKARDVKHKKNKEKIKLSGQHSLDSNNVTYQRASLPANGKEYIKSVSEVDLSSYETCTPNYRVLPNELQVPLVSQHAKLNSSVLNDSCVLVNNRVNSSKNKSNQYEDILFKCEDDMFEVDMLLGSIKATIESVKKMITMLPDKKTHPDFQFQIEEYLTTSNMRCIVHLYDTNWQDMLDAIRQNAGMMSIILHRLEQREKELECYRLDFHKLCRDVYAKNIPKLYNR